MNMATIREKFPDAEVVELNDLIPAEDVGAGPWKLYIFGRDGFHEGGKWFRNGRMKYPAEEISFARARQFADVAVGKGFEVRICDGMDHLVFHSENGKIVHGNTFWNEACPDPAVVKVAERLIGKVKK